MNCKKNIVIVMTLMALFVIITPAFSNVVKFESDRTIDYLIQDHYPEIILGSGKGLIGKHIVFAGNNFLTSYHQNMASMGDSEKRQIIYNFTAQENNTEITFYRANFVVDPVGIKASAVSVGDFQDLSFDKLFDNVCFFEKVSDCNIIMLDEDGRFSFAGMMIIKLNRGETFSSAIPRSMEKGEFFASAIEFVNNKDIILEIRSSEEENIFIENSGTEKFNRARCKDIEPLPPEYGNLSNLNKEQVSGVFKDPNFDITGNIIADNSENAEDSTLIVMPPADLNMDENDEVFIDCSEVEATNEKGETNKYCYSQNFHYILRIDNYNPSRNYIVVLLPGEGAIASYGLAEPVFAYADSMENCALSYPSKVFKQNGDYYIEFNYSVIHGSSRFVYVKILEKSIL